MDNMRESNTEPSLLNYSPTTGTRSKSDESPPPPSLIHQPGALSGPEKRATSMSENGRLSAGTGAGGGGGGGGMAMVAVVVRVTAVSRRPSVDLPDLASSRAMLYYDSD
ncbi:hypothetical protein BJV78DRAFT_1152922 [Lactifluus subvellereus]|nr:hypothetical protein BJV78DRAFT_1152922 [Lactifluus subvellereus]